MNPNSSYDILYKGMSDEDRNRLQEDVAAALKKGTEEVNGLLTREVERAVTELYTRLIANPWRIVIEENSNQYEFIEAIRKSIWTAMLKSSPAEAGEYPVRELIESWQKNFPEDWKKCVGEETDRQIKSLEERLEFEIRCARRS